MTGTETSFGLQKHYIDKIKSVFSQYPQIEEALLFGSRAKGNFNPGSDVDLVLKGNELNYNILLKIYNSLDAVSLPYKIDLLIFKDIKEKDIIDHIARVGIFFYLKK